jgi:hypothetical protein
MAARIVWISSGGSRGIHAPGKGNGKIRLQARALLLIRQFISFENSRPYARKKTQGRGTERHCIVAGSIKTPAPSKKRFTGSCLAQSLTRALFLRKMEEIASSFKLSPRRERPAPGVNRLHAPRFLSRAVKIKENATSFFTNRVCPPPKETNHAAI